MNKVDFVFVVAKGVKTKLQTNDKRGVASAEKVKIARNERTGYIDPMLFLLKPESIA